MALNEDAINALLKGNSAGNKSDEFVTYKVYTGSVDKPIWLANLSLTKSVEGKVEGTDKAGEVLLENLKDAGIIASYSTENAQREVASASDMSKNFAKLLSK